MKNKIYAAVIAIILSALVPINNNYAQDDMNWDAKFALGIGVTPSWIVPNFSEFNIRLNDFSNTDFPSSGFFAFGGSGYVSLPMIKNIRIGGMGFSGSVSRKSVSGVYRKEAVFSASLGGFSIEYTLPFIKRVAVSLGAVIGSGNITVELYQHKGDMGWTDAWDLNSDSASYRKLYNSYFSVTPTLNVDIPVYRFAALRIGTGYQFALNDSWHMDNSVLLNSNPKRKASDWMFFQIGLFIGYFSF